MRTDALGQACACASSGRQANSLQTAVALATLALLLSALLLVWIAITRLAHDPPSARFLLKWISNEWPSAEKYHHVRTISKADSEFTISNESTTTFTTNDDYELPAEGKDAATMDPLGPMRSGLPDLSTVATPPDFTSGPGLDGDTHGACAVHVAATLKLEEAAPPCLLTSETPIMSTVPNDDAGSRSQGSSPPSSPLPLPSTYDMLWKPPTPRRSPSVSPGSHWKLVTLSPASSSALLPMPSSPTSPTSKICIFCNTELHEGISVHNKLRHPFACQLCRLDLTTQDALNQHNMIVHNRRLQCKACGRAFAEMEHLSQHKRDSHQLKCALCDKVFFSQGGLDMHMHAKHPRTT